MDIIIAPLLEKTRRLLEERDAVMLAAIQEHSKLVKIKSHKERLKSEHFIRNAVDHVRSLDHAISNHQTTQESGIQAEREKLVAHADLSIFYGMLKQLKEYHRRFPNEPADVQARLDNQIDMLRVDEEHLEGMFSGAESLGKFLDLSEVFLLYQQDKLRGTHDYLHYTRSFHDFNEFDLFCKMSPQYASYLSQLCEYLQSFMRRAVPLSFNNTVIDDEQALDDDKILVAELEKANNVRFDKTLFCPHCDKLFTNPNSHESHLQGKQHIKNVEKGHLSQKSDEEITNMFDEQKREKVDKVRNILKLQQQIKKLSHELEPFIMATALNIERKQAMTPEELMEEEKRERERLRVKEKMMMTAEDGDRSFMDKDMDGGVYNPLKLPLDWDGKPIPLWLWKLHGLGTKYPCEVCGNYVYLGRKAFDQHFMEWRHTHGMRCLGVPNTRHFYQITKIEDVLRLWETMKVKAPASAGTAATIANSNNEEVEDRHGNVYTKKVFEDMRRQGLI